MTNPLENLKAELTQANADFEAGLKTGKYVHQSNATHTNYMSCEAYNRMCQYIGDIEQKIANATTPAKPTFKVEDLQRKLAAEYKMEAIVYPLGQDVVFLGSELECYKLAYKMKAKDKHVSFSINLGTWHVSFPNWFDADFAQMIK